MINAISKKLLQKVETASYSSDGITTISLEEYTDVNAVKAAVLEVEKIPDLSDLKFDLNEGTLILSLYNPKEDINGFANRHPNREKCGGPQ